MLLQLVSELASSLEGAEPEPGQGKKDNNLNSMAWLGVSILVCGRTGRVPEKRGPIPIPDGVSDRLVRHDAKCRRIERGTPHGADRIIVG